MTNAKLNGFSMPIFTAKDVAQIPVLEVTFPENLSNEDKRWQKKANSSYCNDRKVSLKIKEHKL